MVQTEQITAALKQTLKTRGVTYAELARRIELSEASVKRLFSHGTFTLRRLDQICAALETDLFDLAKLGRYRAETVSELARAGNRARQGSQAVDALPCAPQRMAVFGDRARV